VDREPSLSVLFKVAAFRDLYFVSPVTRALTEEVLCVFP